VTVVVGYRAGEVGLSGLHLAVRVARTRDTSLTVATIVPKPWLTPSLGHVDAEYVHWADNLAADSADEVEGYLHGLADGIEVTYVHLVHRSVSGGLIQVIDEVDAEIVVLGSLPSGGRGQVVIGSTADWLLHVSPVPVAISPRGYRSYTGGLTRVTCAYSATPDSIDVVRRCVEFTQPLGLPIR
jgi:nucleotide-binding universal stress UspA family protein